MTLLFISGIGLLEINISRYRGHNRYVGGGGIKPRSSSDQYENQNNVKQKTATPLAQWL